MDTKQWRTKDGRKLMAEEMSTEHIVSALSLLKRKGFVSLSTLEFYLTCRPPTGEGAQIAFGQECSRIFAAPASPFIDIFEEELKKRGGEEHVS